jgi:hypothetical protein
MKTIEFDCQVERDVKLRVKTNFGNNEMLLSVGTKSRKIPFVLSYDDAKELVEEIATCLNKKERGL